MPDIFVSDQKNQDNTVPIISNSPKTIDTPLEEEDNPNSQQINRPHIFSSFCKNPEGVSFQNQEANEKILLFIRKSLVTNFPWLFIALVLVLIPFIIPFLKPLIGNPLAFLPAKFQLVLLISYYLLVATYAYISFITWYFNISLVTNLRILDVDFESLVYKDVASTKLSLVQDVSYTQIGVLRNFFDYGDVLVQTAGTIDNFVFSAAPQPENVVHVIGDLIGKYDNV